MSRPVNYMLLGIVFFLLDQLGTITKMDILTPNRCFSHVLQESRAARRGRKNSEGAAPRCHHGIVL